jgi:hypothetical protein
MSESLLKDETLTTADIAHPVRAGLVPPTDTNERNIPPAQKTIVPQQTIDVNPLFPDDELHNFRARWDQVQLSFVDEPRQP